MVRAMMTVIGDLADYAQPDEAAPLSRRIVACIEGRGPFDRMVSAMLVQLLAQRGVESRVIANEAVSRDAIGRADLSDVSVFLLSCFEPWGPSAHVRYLVKRLRQGAPGATIIVGVWSELGGEVRAADIDIYAATLREAVDRAMRSDVAMAVSA
jgi:hypothetical protein